LIRKERAIRNIGKFMGKSSITGGIGNHGIYNQQRETDWRFQSGTEKYWSAGIFMIFIPKRVETTMYNTRYPPVMGAVHRGFSYKLDG